MRSHPLRRRRARRGEGTEVEVDWRGVAAWVARPVVKGASVDDPVGRRDGDEVGVVGHGVVRERSVHCRAVEERERERERARASAKAVFPSSHTRRYTEQPWT